MDKQKVSMFLLGVILSLSSMAQEIEFNGFASVGLGIFSEDDFEFQGVNDSLSSDPFNVFALQAKANVNERTTVTAQLLSRGLGQEEDDYEIQTQWLYLTLKASDTTNVRIGRFRSPLYFYSDFFDVGYAYPWISPPSTVYNLSAFDSVEGIDIVNNHPLGSWNATFQAFYGEYTDEMFVFEEYGGLSYSAENDWLTLRFTYVINGSIEAVLDPTFVAGLEALGAASPELVDALDVKDETVEFTGLAVVIDYNNFLFTSEATTIDFEEQSLFSDSDQWYAMIGYRFNNLTFHLTYGELETDPDFSSIDSILAPISAVDPATAATLRATAVSFINLSTSDDTNTTLGVRWDYSASSAIKFEISQVEETTFDFVSNSFVDQDGTLFAVAIDTVF